MSDLCCFLPGSQAFHVVGFCNQPSGRGATPTLEKSHAAWPPTPTLLPAKAGTAVHRVDYFLLSSLDATYVEDDCFSYGVWDWLRHYGFSFPVHICDVRRRVIRECLRLPCCFS